MLVHFTLHSSVSAVRSLMFQRYEVSVPRSSSSSPGLARVLWRLGDLRYPGPRDVLTVELQDVREIAGLLPVGSEIGEINQVQEITNLYHYT